MTWRSSLIAAMVALAAASLAAQTPVLPSSDPPHDASLVDTASIGSAIATPLPESERRRLRKYEIPELAGAHQALGSHTIEGSLPRPVADYIMHAGHVTQRLSIFEGGLVVVQMTGAGGKIRKKLLLPEDARDVYLRHLSVTRLASIRSSDLMRPQEKEKATLRLYRADGSFVERSFAPASMLPQDLADQLAPLQDLIRAISIDREVTNSIANYRPAIGDELLADDSHIYKVIRVFGAESIVELRCENQPTTIYVAQKDLYNYFVGRRDHAR